jgi:hypothetical protein
MKVLFLGDDLIFKVVPRIFPSLADELSLTLTNENSKTVINPTFTFELNEKRDKLVITLSEQPEDFKAQNKYDIEIQLNGSIIYLGKLIVLDSGTNVQNYEYGSQSTSRFKFKE